MNDRVVVVDNFFNNFNLLEEHFKKISVYTLDEFVKKDENADTKQKWPGKRSLKLINQEPFLQALVIKEFNEKFNHFFHPKWRSLHLYSIYQLFLD